MLVSFVVELISNSEINENKTPSQYFNKVFFSFSEGEYIISKIFGKNINKVKLNPNEKFKLRITTLTKESFENITMGLFKKKLLEEPIEYDNTKFSVVNIYSGGRNKIWGNTYKDLKLSDTPAIFFSTPLIIKFGEQFIEEFDLFLFVKSILKRSELKIFTVTTNYNNREIFKLIEKIKYIDRTFVKKIIYKKVEYTGLLGEVRFDLSHLEENEKTFIKNIFKIGYFIYSGQETKNGFGMYKLKQ